MLIKSPYCVIINIIYVNWRASQVAHCVLKFCENTNLFHDDLKVFSEWVSITQSNRCMVNFLQDKHWVTKED